MGTLTSSLRVSLIDDVSRRAGLISKALALAEKQTKALAAASKAGVSDRMATQLQRLGAGSREIERVSEAWQRYSRAQGLAASSSDWTKSQVRGVKEWERANVAAIKRVQDHSAPRRSRATVAESASEKGLSAGQGALIGGAASRASMVMRAAPVLAVGAGLYKATSAALSFEEVMYEVQKATDSNAEGLQRYSTAILDLSTKTGKKASELGGILAAAGFAGRPKEELLAFTTFAAKATGAWGTTAEATGQALAEIGNIYQANQARIESIGDAINSVADSSASKETDLLDFIRRTGAQAKILGMDAEPVLAFGAAFKEVGVQSEVAATGFNALLTKLSTGVDDDEWNKQLKDIGINTKSFTKTLNKDAPEAIKTLLTQINKIEDGTKKMSVLKDMFGAEYADDIARLAGNLPGLIKMLDLVGNKARFIGSVDKSFQLLTEKDYNRVARFNAQMERFAISVGGPLKTALGAAADEASRLFESFQDGGAGAKAVEAINKRAATYNADIIAREELRTGRRGNYDPETRARIDERAAGVEREAIDKTVGDIDRQVAARDRILLRRPGDSVRKPAEEERAKLIAERQAIFGARDARDQAKTGLADVNAKLDAFDGRRMKGFGGYYGDRPQPIVPGRASFGFGAGGSRGPADPDWMPKPNVTAPMPAPRPAGLPKVVPVLNRFEDIYDDAALTAAAAKARVTGEEIKTALGVTATPQVDSSQIDALNSKIAQARAGLTSLGAEAGAAAQRSTGVVGRTMRGIHADVD